jgi:hypothetical protein
MRVDTHLMLKVRQERVAKAAKELIGHLRSGTVRSSSLLRPKFYEPGSAGTFSPLALGARKVE